MAVEWIESTECGREFKRSDKLAFVSNWRGRIVVWMRCWKMPPCGIGFIHQMSDHFTHEEAMKAADLYIASAEGSERARAIGTFWSRPCALCSEPLWDHFVDGRNTKNGVSCRMQYPK